jgi:uncharacterized cupredoxin-like copper-binding protein
MRRFSSAAAGVAVGAVILLGTVGCSAGQAGARAGSTVLRVTERDFKISSPKHTSSRDVLLSVRNKGPDQHELIVVRERGSRLPLRRDGLTVNEEMLERATVGVLEPGSPGSRRELAVHLAPGRYVLFCNMSGHYLGGMHAVLVVR